MSGESSRSIEYSQHIGLVTRERDHRATQHCFVLLLSNLLLCFVILCYVMMEWCLEGMYSAVHIVSIFTLID